ncbi:MAG: hypothetical protein FJ291_06320 [Planctomycetes bacterium]|nr:hypothetical protein [Planctomycetota bacterium]
MAAPTCKGIVKGRTVILKGRPRLREGTEVVVTPVQYRVGSPQAVVAAMKAPPHLKHEDVVEFMRLIEEGKRPARYGDPFERARRKANREGR